MDFKQFFDEETEREKMFSDVNNCNEQNTSEVKNQPRIELKRYPNGCPMGLNPNSWRSQYGCPDFWIERERFKEEIEETEGNFSTLLNNATPEDIDTNYYYQDFYQNYGFRYEEALLLDLIDENFMNFYNNNYVNFYIDLDKYYPFKKEEKKDDDYSDNNMMKKKFKQKYLNRNNNNQDYGNVNYTYNFNNQSCINFKHQRKCSQPHENRSCIINLKNHF